MAQSVVLGLYLIVSLLIIFKVLAPFLSTAATKEKVLDKEMLTKPLDREKGKN